MKLNVKRNSKLITNFASDNTTAVHPDILEAMTSVNYGNTLAYGHDEYTKAADKKFREHFGNNLEAYFVFNGTAANVIGLRGLTESFHSIVCAEMAHINLSECNAVERFTGCKLLSLPSQDGKITVEQVKSQMHVLGEQHHAQPKVISITQPTEYGVVYTPKEIKTLSDFAHKNNMLIHMDGARLANAAAALGISLRKAGRDCGVDVLSFGGTKNGIMFGEAVIFFDRKVAQNFKYVRKQGMQLASKMRFIAAQFIALLSDDLWKTNAKHANEMAKYLERKLRLVPKIKVVQKVQTNAVFVTIPPKYIPLIQKKYFFYIWDARRSEIRLMTAFDTKKEEIDSFVKFLKETIK